MQNYIGYMKCGEILRPPFESYQRPYVLKCFHCKELYMLFEAFIFHIEDHCKNAIVEIKAKSNAEECLHITQDYAVEERMELNDNVDVNIKLEETNFSPNTEDPLVVVKPESIAEDGESSSVKQELMLPDNETCNIDFDDENNSTTTEEAYETDAELESQNSDDEIENSTECSLTSAEESLQELSIAKKSNNDLFCSRKQSDFIKEFLKTKPHVVALIESYKNQPSLWNKNFPFFGHKIKRQNCLQKLADEINEQHDLSMTWNQVASVIVYLCRKYREDLKSIEEKKEGEEKHVSSWFFEDLSFLKPFMKNNSIAKLGSRLPDLLPNQIKEILETYKGFPHLWNTQLVEHYCKNKIYAAKQEMLQVLETKMGVKITENILEDYFRTINNCFLRAKRNKLDKNSNKNNSVTCIEDSAQEDYYEYMLFLNDHVGSFKCSDCQRSFKSPLHLKIHESQVHGSDPLSCSLCGKLFKKLNSFRNHAKRHMKDFNHECKECGKKFLRSAELRIHMRNHTGAKPFCCEICGASFRHTQSFTKHHRRHIKNYLHTCEICGKGFYSKDRYNDHMNTHSNTRNQVCNVCGKTFVSKRSLQQHLIIHDDTRGHTCKLCGKAFTTKRSLQQHVVIHEDIRRHVCKLCGKAFKHKTGVNQHMRTHDTTNIEEKSTVKKE